MGPASTVAEALNQGLRNGDRNGTLHAPVTITCRGLVEEEYRSPVPVRYR
jgi:hypothetical protein